MKIGLLCEGSTDVPVLQAVIGSALGPGHMVRQIQVNTDGTTPRTGASSVELWCKQNGRRLDAVLRAAGLDLLVVHLDADVRRQKKVDSTAALCDLIKGWLGLRAEGRRAEERRVIIVIPAEETETWLLASRG
ncbi:MAG TPA: hypothetical protein VLS89_03650, partial [Candidatus Nanopelagicales bacterium]|nr:hypothetical protein [Candidatus Nanopelagicales bacterium]